MQLQRHFRLVLSVATLTLIASSPAEFRRSLAQTGDIRSPSTKPITDSRERVRVTPAEREVIRLEMRTMLQSLSGIMHGLIAGDLAMGQKAAHASGMVTSLDSSLEKKLPPDFRQLSTRTHRRFDALADAMKTGAARDAVLKQLAAVTASCVTCHDTYRLDEARE
jgi:hypothetical protein